jgi:hypothetical protein
MSIGEPIRYATARFSKTLQNLDILEDIVLDFYIGGLILYAIATIPMHLFSPEILAALLLTSIVLSFLLHHKDVSRLKCVPIKKIRSCFSANALALLEGSVVFFLFLATLWLELLPVTNFVFGNVHDSSLYGLFVKLILQNRQIPATMLPYSTEGIYYPQAFFTMEAFAHLVTGLSLAEISLRVTPLFQALAVLGAYSLGRRIGPKNHLGVSFAWVFFAVSRWPRLLVWGSNPFVGGFALYFVCIGLLFQLRNSEKNGNAMIGTSFTGILLGYLGAINLVFLQALVPVVAIIAILRVRRMKQQSAHTQVRAAILLSLLVLGCSLVVISPSVYKFMLSAQHGGSNVGLPADLLIPSANEAVSQVVFELTEIYRGFFFLDWISPYRFLKFETALLVSATMAVIFINIGRKEREIKDSIGLILISLTSVALVLLVRTVGALISLSLTLILTNWAETAIIMFVSFCFFVCVLNVLIYNHIRGLVYRWHKPSSTKKVCVAALTLVVLSSIYTPYIYYLFLHDSNYLTGQYDIFCVTTQNDLELMQWMKQNMPKESVVLINPYDAGGFVPVVTDLKVIYPFIQSRSSLSYLFLTSSLNQGNLSSTVYDMLDQRNITHVFIGEHAMSGHERFDPLLFLGNPNFRLERHDGDAYLFALVHANRSVFFSDDFERSSLEDGGWKTQFSSANSSGEATIVDNPQKAFNGCRCLRISVKTAPRTDQSSTWVFRKVYLPSFEDQPSVRFSFYLDHDGSVGNFEGFTVIVSDESWTKKVFISTYERGGYTLPASQGLFEVDLGRIWNEIFHSKLPSAFFLQLENFDKDGFENVFYVDRIRLIVSDK